MKQKLLNSKKSEELFYSELEKLGLAASSSQKKSLSLYSEQILKWNRRFNLVSAADSSPEKIFKHILDSLLFFKYISPHPGSGLLDIGSGAGFPAIPIKIFRPDLELTLLESTHKKFLFLKKVSDILNFKNIIILNVRAEQMHYDENLEVWFDYVTAKALGNLKETWKLASFFLKPSGVLVTYKGEKAQVEIKELESSSTEQDWRLKQIGSFESDRFGIKRNLVLIEKI